MPSPEGRLSTSVMKWLRSLPDTYARRVNDLNNVGAPDIDGCYKGLAFYIELKTKTGKVSDRQAYEHKKIAAAGGRVFVARSLFEVQRQFVAWFNIDEIYCERIRPKARRARGGEAGGQ